MLREIDFGKEVMARVTEALPQYQIAMEEVVKANDETLHGIVIRKRKEGASPVFYREEMYGAYEKGATIGEIVEQILRVFESAESPFDSGDINPLKEKLGIRLLDPEINRDYLEDVPSITLASGLVMVCDAIRPDGEGGEYRAIIKNGMIRKRCSKQELIDRALDNMRERESPVLQDISWCGLSEENLMDEERVDSSSIYMLTNRSRIFGAAEIILKEVRKRIAELVGGGYYVVPSSLHEMLIVPEDAGVSKNRLQTILRNTNKDVLRPEDVLSNHVYYVDGREFELELA